MTQLELPRVILADPPWRFRDGLPTTQAGTGRGATAKYTTLPTDTIKRLVIPRVADVAALVLWRVAALPQDALDVIQAWGFEPKTEIVWRKVFPCANRKCEGYDVDSPDQSPGGMCPRCGQELARWFAMGWYTRAEHETAIIATRGQATKLVRSHSVRSTFIAPADRSEGGHSKKPAAIHGIVEELFQGPYVELFARRERPGWDCWGDEIGKPLKVGPPVRGDQLLLGGG